MAKLKIERDNGDYFEIHETAEGATLEYFVLEGAEAHLDMSLDFNSPEEAKKAIDGFGDIEDLIK